MQAHKFDNENTINNNVNINMNSNNLDSIELSSQQY